MLARVWGSEYAWYEHKPIALEAGVSPDVVEAIRTNAEPSFVKADEAVIHTFLTDPHLRPQGVWDGGYAEAVERLGEAGVIDLVGLAGYYTLSCMTMTVFQVAQPAGVPSELGA